MLTNGVTEKIYFQLDHVILTKCDCLDEQESLDYVFEQQGMKRKIVMAIPIASTLFDLVANTDLVAAARSRFVKVYGNGPDIEIHKLSNDVAAAEYVSSLARTLRSRPRSSLAEGPDGRYLQANLSLSSSRRSVTGNF